MGRSDPHPAIDSARHSPWIKALARRELFHVERPPAPIIVSRETSTIYTVSRETSCLSVNLSATFAPRSGEQPLARVIAITNQKGGVGKTTTAVNLGASLAASEQRTLVIDCDPQGNTTSALGFPKDPARRTLYQALILDEPIDRIILDVQVEGMDLIPSDKNLVGAAVELVNLENREYRLKALVAGIQARYNYVLIDCPPSLDLLTLNALAASDSVLVPIQCEYLALEGVSELLDTLMRLRRTINPSLAIEGILLTMYDDRTTLSKQVAADLRSFFGAQVFETVIPRNVRLAEAPSHGMPVMFYDIHSKGAESYIQLAKEVISNPQKRVGPGTERPIRGPEPNQQQPPAQVPAAASAAQPPVTTPQQPTVAAGTAAAAAPALAPNDGFLQVDIDLIDPSPYQPRTRFREEALDELARSIRASGIVQPLVVRSVGKRYQLIAGERRWRASQRAGLDKVSVIVREVPDELALEMTLVENIQREDLNAMEAARAFERLMDEFQMTQEQVAERTGKDPATVGNAIRLLNLEPIIQDWIEEGKLTAGHGRGLLAVQDPKRRMRF